MSLAAGWTAVGIRNLCRLSAGGGNDTGEVVSAAKDYDPARITRYVIDLANLFHKFYNACRVKGEEDSLCQARLTLCVAVKTVIHNVLTMFKISAPESM